MHSTLYALALALVALQNVAGFTPSYAVPAFLSTSRSKSGVLSMSAVAADAPTTSSAAAVGEKIR
jgi:hypothetical protein